MKVTYFLKKKIAATIIIVVAIVVVVVIIVVDIVVVVMDVVSNGDDLVESFVPGRKNSIKGETSIEIDFTTGKKVRRRGVANTRQ